MQTKSFKTFANIKSIQSLSEKTGNSLIAAIDSLYVLLRLLEEMLVRLNYIFSCRWTKTFLTLNSVLENFQTREELFNLVVPGFPADVPTYCLKRRNVHVTIRMF